MNTISTKTNSITTNAIEWLNTQQGQMENLLRDLVEVSSWTYDKKGVDTASEILRQSMPLALTSVPSDQFGNQSLFHNLVPASQNGTLLIGHMDTVFPKEKFSGFRKEDNHARGPGVLDMKGGLVIIAYALQALRIEGILDSIPLSCVVVSEEEIGSPESTPLLRTLSKGVRAALTFESGRAGDAIITRRKGTGTLTATAYGRAAHAGNAHSEGANAIWSLARFVDKVQNLTNYDSGTTLNVGKISGGIGKNTVPDSAEAIVDIRYITQADSSQLRSTLEKIAKECAVSGTRIELEWGPGRVPMEKTKASHDLMENYSHCQKTSGLGGGECGLVGGGSDAATLSQEGVPSIDGLGPRGKGFHTLEEYVELDSLIPKAQALVRFLKGEK
jgi:glutamate carboxypeptidase